MQNDIFIYDKNFWNDKSLKYLKIDKNKKVSWKLDAKLKLRLWE